MQALKKKLLRNSGPGLYQGIFITPFHGFKLNLNFLKYCSQVVNRSPEYKQI